MALSAELLAILACPECKGNIESMDDEPFLVCRICRLKYPVLDGIPLMLAEEAVSLDEA